MESGDVMTALVSCVMPTCDRRRFVPDAIENFLLQTYADRELVDRRRRARPGRRPGARRSDGSATCGSTGELSTGAKRNLACRARRGDHRALGRRRLVGAGAGRGPGRRAARDAAPTCAGSATCCSTSRRPTGAGATGTRRARPALGGRRDDVLPARAVGARTRSPTSARARTPSSCGRGRGLACTRSTATTCTSRPSTAANTSAKRTSGRRWTSVPVADDPGRPR